MSPGPRLVLKQSTGWFAAGWTFADAMTALSDLAFKLSVGPIPHTADSPFLCIRKRHPIEDPASHVSLA